MASYFLGVDIGGSKSHALVADRSGRALGFGQGGPGNYEVVGWSGLRDTLQNTVADALATAAIAPHQIAGAGFGVAGYDWPGEEAPTRQAIESLELSAAYGLVNDAVIALLAGAKQGWGVAVVAGTSNNCRGLDQQGREGRVTGCGPSFGEYGGAGEMVARAVQMISLAWSKRGPSTDLTAAFLELTGAVNAADLLEGLALARYQLSPAAAPAIFQLAAQSDAVAQDIVRWAGRELGSLAVGVIRQLSLENVEFPVILAGSLYDGGPMLVEAMARAIQEIAPRANLVRLTVPPVVGGVILGMEEAGISAPLLLQTLTESTTELIGSDFRFL
jgi:N-acetylglucosamine kinase-like BadF-type ATPase